MHARMSRVPWTFGDGFDLRLFDPVQKSYVDRVEMKVISEEDGDPWLVEIPPAVRLSNDQAQSILDDLWREGLRPSVQDGRRAEGALDATKAHLEDMRRLVFDGVPSTTRGSQDVPESP